MLEIVNQIKPKTDNKKKSNSFPLEVFPSLLRDYIAEMDAGLGYPPDYTAAAILYALSIAIGNTRRIELKQDFTSGANIFLITIGRPGANKSRPFKKVLSYISDLDYQNFINYKKDLSYYEEEKAKSQDNRDPDLKKPECINYLLNDFTPEVLANQLSINKRGLGVFVDEILGWLKNINRYSNGSSEEMYLSLWSGMDLKVNRVSKEQLNVKNPFASIAGTIQPMKLKNAFKGKEENGLTDRILFVFPEEIKANKWNEDNIDLSLHSEWCNLLGDLYRKLDFQIDRFGGCEPKFVKMSQDARRIIIEWQNQQENSLINDDEESQSIGAKMQDYLLRFCLILHISEWISGTTEEFLLNEDTARKGIILTEYFTSQALKVRDFIYSNTDVLSGLSKVKQDLFNELSLTFPLSDGILLAEKKGISKSTAKRFFNSEKYFSKVSHGIYQKVIK